MSISRRFAMSDAACSHCGALALIRAGRNRSGTQRWQCRACGRYTTLAPKEHGYSAETREMGVRLYLEGTSLRGTGRLLGAVHQTVANWVADAGRALPAQVADTGASETIEVDELETYVAKKG